MSIFSGPSIITWLNTLAGYTYQMSLHSSDPLSAVDPATTEISGGSYVRKSATFARNNLSLWNSAIVTFDGLPAATVTHVGVWYTSGPDSGSMAFSVPLTNSFATSSGSSWSIEANECVIYL